MFQVTNISLYILGCHTTECAYSAHCVYVQFIINVFIVSKATEIKVLFLKETHFFIVMHCN